jgi:hypothetical protein
VMHKSRKTQGIVHTQMEHVLDRGLITPLVPRPRHGSIANSPAAIEDHIVHCG